MSTRKKASKNSVSEVGSANQAGDPNEPAEEEIRVRAYEIYVQRGQVIGFDLEDWLQAEEELRQGQIKRTD
jgi:hypothetical protein